jgi:hypothetical protein
MGIREERCESFSLEKPALAHLKDIIILTVPPRQSFDSFLKCTLPFKTGMHGLRACLSSSKYIESS